MIANRIRYLRVSLATACNFNCFYCKPKGMQTGNAMLADFDGMTESVTMLHRLGVKKVRFTGGEPTIYPKLVETVARTRAIDPDLQICMTTNGRMLKKLALPLAKAGLDSVNISLDTINRERFLSITGFDAFDEVLSGIETAVENIKTVKLNCVMIKGVNDHEAADMVAFANRLGVDIRFIEYMPTRFNSNTERGFIAGDDLRASLPYILTPTPAPVSSAAKYYQSQELDIRVGFIDPVSHSFCAECDRLRLAADGKLFGCLFSGASINLFDLIARDKGQALAEIQHLVKEKTYAGCAALQSGSDGLPSFVNIGG